MGKLGILVGASTARPARSPRPSTSATRNLADVDPETGEFTYREGMVSGVGEMLFFCPSTGGFKALRAMAYHRTQAPCTCRSTAVRDGRLRTGGAAAGRRGARAACGAG